MKERTFKTTENEKIRELLLDLSPYASKIFLYCLTLKSDLEIYKTRSEYITSEIKKTKTHISVEEFTFNLGTGKYIESQLDIGKKKTINKALNEMWEREILYKKSINGNFFLNPAYAHSSGIHLKAILDSDYYKNIMSKSRELYNKKMKLGPVGPLTWVP